MSGDICQPVQLPDGTIVSVHGADEPLSDDARNALATIAEAARARFAEQHADDPPALATVADAVHGRAKVRGMSLRDVAEELDLPLSRTLRLTQQSGKLTIGELATFARWAGLDITAVPVVTEGPADA